MKKYLLTCLALLCALGVRAQSVPADNILAFVRENLPGNPLKLTGTLKQKAANGHTTTMPVEMELDWGAAVPTAIYRIGEPGAKQFQSLTITWHNEKPSYAFSDSKNDPSSVILDTGITWADLSFSVFWWPGSKLVDEGTKLNRECYIVDVPVPDSENTMRLWIEKNMGMLLEARTLDAKQKELRRMNIVSIKKMDNMWMAKDLKLEDKKTGQSTTIEISNLEWINGAPAADEPTSEAFDPSASVNKLAFDLYQKLAADNEGNLFFSPYSISSALAMTYGGARGETATQMNNVLHFGGPDATHPAFSHLRNTLAGIEKKGGVQLSVANALWPQQDYSFRSEFLELAKTQYGSEVRPVDFKTNAGGARQAINTWVEDQTNEKIKDLIGEGVLDSLTRLVLVNAIYFKGDWASQFDAEATCDAPFHLTEEKSVQVPMMSQKADFGFAETDDFEALELPYEGGDLSMLVLLPSNGNTTESLVQKLSPDTLSGLSFRKQELVVNLPKFKLESSFDLGGTLQQMGMTDAFSDAADFSGMDGTRELFISAVLHKAFVEVNEEGTEAAAATAVVMKLRSVPPPPRQFIADHPFLFFIRENSTGAILFMGRVMDPR